ncbi:MAG TPA: hypothetical protein VLC08_16015 [Chitinolyticbacter sp.]|nr:hypothetical protein [Chitinolyticbacter sp.]
MVELAFQVWCVAGLVMLIAAGVLWHRTRTPATLMFLLALLGQNAGQLSFWLMLDLITHTGMLLLGTWGLVVTSVVASASLLAHVLSLPRRGQH